MIEKAGVAEAKAILQPPFSIQDIDARCPKDHRPLAKKDKEDTYQEPRNKAPKNKAKSQNSSSANVP